MALVSARICLDQSYQHIYRNMDCWSRLNVDKGGEIGGKTESSRGTTQSCPGSHAEGNRTASFDFVRIVVDQCSSDPMRWNRTSISVKVILFRHFYRTEERELVLHVYLIGFLTRRMELSVIVKSATQVTAVNDEIEFLARLEQYLVLECYQS